MFDNIFGSIQDTGVDLVIESKIRNWTEYIKQNSIKLLLSRASNYGVKFTLDFSLKNHGILSKSLLSKPEGSAYLQNLRILHHHMVSWYPIMIEPQEPVVSRVESHLWSDLSHRDAWEGHVSVLITDLDDEWMGAVAFSLREQLGYHDAIVCCVSNCNIKWGEGFNQESTIAVLQMTKQSLCTVNVLLLQKV